LEIREKEYGILDLLTIPFRCNWAAAGSSCCSVFCWVLVPTVQVIATAAFIDGVLDVYWARENWQTFTAACS